MNTPSFQSWFSGSKIVDVRGQPLVVYHGTVADITAFDPGKLGHVTGAADARAGFYFAENPNAADQFTWKDGEKTGSIYPTYLAIKNPVVIDDLLLDGATGTAAGRRLEAAKAAGHDGAIFLNADMLGHTGRVFVAFHPNQIKSAVGNRGTFNPDDPDIRFSQPSIADANVLAQLELPLQPVADVTPDLRKKVRRLEAAGQEAGRFKVEAVAPLSDLISGDHPSPVRMDSPTFYSALAKGIREQIPGNKAGFINPKAAIEWIDARAREGRLFKTAEVEWSGVRDWLHLLHHPVHVDDVVKFIEQHGVRVEETLLTGPSRHELSEKANAAGHAFRAALRAAGGVASGTLRLSPDELMWSLLEGDVQIEDLNVELRDPAKSWVSAARAHDEFKVDGNDSPRFSVHTLPHGEDYRELLLTLPPLRLNTAGWTATPYREGWYKVRDEQGREIANMYGDTPEEAIDEARRYHETAPERRRLRDFTSKHWSEFPNVLCHIRFNTRPAPSGGKLLFVEEIQSDWQQIARKEGVRRGLQPVMHSDITVESETDTTWILTDTRNKVSASIVKAPYEKQGGLVRALDDFALQRIREHQEDMKKPPAGPFMSETKDWVALAIKRLLRYAVDNDYAAVAFINGQQSVDRNGVRAEVDKLVLVPGPTPGEVIIKARRRGSDAVDKFASCPLDKLGNYIGKELADKVGSAPSTKAVVLEDLDLQIGGHGMLTFYNEIVPQVANSVLKKLGCAKLAPISVKTREPYCSPGSIHIEAANGKFWLTQNDLRRSRDYDSYAAADQARLQIYQDEEAGATPQLGFVVTEGLRAQVAQGLPLFSRTIPEDGPSRPMSPPDLAAVGLLSDFFDTPVAVLRTSQDSEFQFNGAMHGSLLYLNERTPRPLHTVFGHELVHKMRAERPDLYATLADALEPLIQNETRYAAKAGLFAKPTPFVREELIADIVGDRFAEHGFWKMVARQAKSRFGEMADFINGVAGSLMQFLTPAANAPKSDPRINAGTSEFLRDLGAARKAIADVILAYAEWSRTKKGKHIFSDEVAQALREDLMPSTPPAANRFRPKAKI